MGWPLHLITLALLLAAGAAFLPTHHSGLPPWRITAVEDLKINLGSLVTPQPWLTAEGLLLFACGLVWCHYVCALPREIDRGLLFGAFCAGVTLLAVVSIGFYACGARWPFWDANYRFGPFPNRNQTADLLAIGALLALGCVHERFRNGKRTWIAWSCAAAVIFAGLVLAYSRAAIVLFFAASIGWIIAMAAVRRSGPRLAIGAGVILVLWSALLFGGGDTLERFLQPNQAGLDITKDFRWTIQKDALAMVSSAPVTGIGLGNFESQFWLFRGALGSANLRVLHPESDWLWLAVEMGWPSVFLVLAGFGLLLARVFPLGKDPGWRLRSAAASAGLLFALHGFVDVSAHRMGSAFPALFALGLALRPQRQPLANSPWQRLIYRAGGVVFCAVGAVWLVFSWNAALLPGQLGATLAKDEARQLSGSKQFERAIEQATTAAKWTPMDWEPYYIRAVATALGTSDDQSAMADFNRARFLNPVTAEIPFNEGVVWLSRRPILALPAWQDALHRAIDSHELYEKMLDSSKAVPGLRRSLLAMASGNVETMLSYLAQAKPAEFAEGLSLLRAKDAELTLLTPVQLQELFKLWHAQGHCSNFLEEVEQHPNWIRTGWASISLCHASHGDFRHGYELARQNMPSPVIPNKSKPESIPALERALYAQPQDFAKRFALYENQLRAGDKENALATLQKATALNQCPSYFFYLEANLLADAQKWQEAWEALKRGGLLNPSVR